MDSTRFNKILSILIEEILPQPIEEIKDIIQSEDFGNIFIIFNNVMNTTLLSINLIEGIMMII